MEDLKVDGISKDFGGVRAVNNVSFKVEKGEHLALIGPNGAGKTTLFNVLSGQLAATSGKVYFKGQDITNQAAYHHAHYGIGRSFQVTALFLNLTVMKNMVLALQGTRASRFQIFRSSTSYRNINEKARNLLESMNLWAVRDEPVHTLAYGEQRKLEIVLSLASEPKLLLLDEPSCGLTTAESADITGTIRSLGKNVTIVFVAHDMDLVYGAADRIIVLHHGEIIADGTGDEISRNPKVKEIYMGSEEVSENAPAN